MTLKELAQLDALKMDTTATMTIQFKLMDY